MKYKEKLLKQVEYYDMKKKAILETIREMEVKKEGSEAINWDEVNESEHQQSCIDYLIDVKLQKIMES